LHGALEVVVVGLGSQRGLEDEAPGLGGGVVVLLPKVQVLRAGFVIDGLAFASCCAHEARRFCARVVRNDNFGFGIGGKPEHALCRFGFGNGRTHVGVASPGRMGFVAGFLGRNDGIVLTMDERDEAVLGGNLKDGQDGLIVEVVVGPVGRVDFERRNPPRGALGDGLKRLGLCIQGSHVKGVVDAGLLCLGKARQKGVMQSLAGGWADEVDHRGDAAKGRFARSDEPIVLRGKDPRIKRNVTMRINGTRQHDEARGVNDAGIAVGMRREVPQGGYLVAANPYVCFNNVVSQNNFAADDESILFMGCHFLIPDFQSMLDGIILFCESTVQKMQ